MLTLEPFCTVPLAALGAAVGARAGVGVGVWADAVDASTATRAAASFTMRVIVTSSAHERGEQRAIRLYTRPPGPRNATGQRDGPGRGSCYYRPTLRAFCAWCQRDGGPSFLGEREPFDDERETHGVCRRHLQFILAT